MPFGARNKLSGFIAIEGMQRSLFVHWYLEKARKHLALGTWDQFCRKVIVDARLRAHEVEIGLARARLEGKGVCV
jgi:hypothetical protein